MLNALKSIIRQHLSSENTTIDGVNENFDKKLDFAVRDIERFIERLWGYPYPIESVFGEIKNVQRQQLRFSDEIFSRINKIQAAIDAQRNNGPICRWREEDARHGVVELIVGGGRSPEEQYEGKRQADKNLADWIKNAVEVICIDPYLFKRSKDDEETEQEKLEKDYEHADQLLSVLGRNKQVQFIYMGNAERGKQAVKISPHVANRIEAKIPEFGIKATFRVVDDLHDRVWLKRDHQGRWFAKVIGTSRDGVGKRPTYLIDMLTEDCREYINYVDHLISVSQANHERPINFKKNNSLRFKK